MKPLNHECVQLIRRDRSTGPLSQPSLMDVSNPGIVATLPAAILKGFPGGTSSNRFDVLEQIVQRLGERRVGKHTVPQTPAGSNYDGVEPVCHDIFPSFGCLGRHLISGLYR